MRSRIGLFVVVVAFLLTTTGISSAQQNNAVRITNGPVVEHVTGTTAEIAWSTSVSAGSILRYGTSPNALTQRAEVPWGGVTHRITIKNLQPNTKYYFQVESTNGQGSGTSIASPVSEFQTTSGTS